MSQHPPKYALRLLRWFCREEYLEEIEGDLIELFESSYEDAPRVARRKFLWNVIKSFRPTNIRQFKLNNWTMYQIKNYSKVYFRRFRNELQHYLINILGLALGFSVLMFIVFYAYDEFHINKGYSKGDDIYRVIIKSTDPKAGVVHHTSAPNPLAEALVNEFPEVKEAARMFYLGSCTLQKEANMFSERKYALTDYSIFNILDFEILDGDPLKDTSIPLGIVLSESTAKRLFGRVDVAGETIESNWTDSSLEVLAVVADMSASSSYQFNALFLSSFDNVFGEGYSRWLKNWDSRGGVVLALFEAQSDPSNLLANKEKFLAKYVPEEDRSEVDFSFQKFGDMHLKSKHIAQGGSEVQVGIAPGDETFINIVLAIGFLVMIIATFNYINLSCVQALKRTHEAGVRKVNGATMYQLRFQLFLENLWTLLIAYLISLLLVFVLFDVFLAISDKSFGLLEIFNSEIIAFQLVLFVAIWILSSIIPAIYYSKLSRSLVLVKNVFSGRGDLLRRAFVTIQYGISLMLVIGSVILYNQLNYVQTKDLGFDNTNLITLDINSGKARRSFREIVRELKQNPNVQNAGASSRVPGEWKWNTKVSLFQVEGENELESVMYGVDQNWLDTYSVELWEGENFKGIDNADTLKIILNQTAASQLGLENPIGKTIWVKEDTVSRMQIVGVVKDFHLESLHQPISPVILTSWNNPIIGLDYFTVKYTGDAAGVIEHIERVQAQFDPETPAELNFLDERWNRYYKADASRSNLILIATAISIIISIFGLFGVVNFSLERRTKEIGIRKVMGASIAHIITISLRDYLVLLGIALVIAAPIAYWVLDDWLSGFAFRISLSPLVFILAFLAVALVSFLTVITRVYRLAISNPINSLKHE